MFIRLVVVRDFRGMKVAEFEPGERAVVLIGGENEEGKSSFLGALDAALGGAKGAPDDPIRHGAGAADIQVELEGDEGVLTVHRRFTKRGTTLELRDATGKIKSPQKLLDKIVGARFLDPLKFIKLKGREQREMLIDCIDVDFDFDANAAARKVAYDDRTLAGRSVKQAKADLKSNPPPEAIPEKSSADELLAELDALMAREAARSRAESELETLRDQYRRHSATIVDVKETLKRAQEQHDDAVAAMAAFSAESDQRGAELTEATRDSVTDEMEVTRTALAEIASTNEARALLVAQQARYDAANNALKAADAEHCAADDRIEALDAERVKALDGVKMPIDGLAITEDDVLFDDVPISQASGARQIRLSVAIAAALRPELRDIWTEDGEKLGANSLEAITEYAKENGLRLWLERISDKDEGAIIIRDGMIVGEEE